MLIHTPRAAPGLQQQAAAPPSHPDAYVIHKFTQRCQCCGSTHHWTETYLRLRTVARLGMGSPPARLKPIHSANEIQWRIPIITEELPCSTVPFCHACESPTIPTYYPVPPQPVTIPSQRTVVGAPPAPKAPPKPKPAPAPWRPVTLDDI